MPPPVATHVRQIPQHSSVKPNLKTSSILMIVFICLPVGCCLITGIINSMRMATDPEYAKEYQERRLKEESDLKAEVNAEKERIALQKEKEAKRIQSIIDSGNYPSDISEANEILKQEGGPQLSVWDGLMEPAHKYLDKNLHDRKSKEVVEASVLVRKTVKGKKVWMQQASIRAKNMFGASVLNQYDFAYSEGELILASQRE